MILIKGVVSKGRGFTSQPPWDDGRSQVLLEAEGGPAGQHRGRVLGWGVSSVGLRAVRAWPGHTVGVQKMATERALRKQDRRVSGTLAEGGRKPLVAATVVKASVLLEHSAGHVPMAGTVKTWPTGAGRGYNLYEVRLHQPCVREEGGSCIGGGLDWLWGSHSGTWLAWLFKLFSVLPWPAAASGIAVGW